MRRLTAVLAVGMVLLAGCSGGTGGGSDAGRSGGGAAEAGVGVAVGGAGDATAFRRNVREGYVPQPTDLTYEGLYHDYYFDTGGTDCDRRFCPAYSRAVSPDPLSNGTERFLTVGLTSGLSAADFERPPVNLVVVVDTSGSMDERIDRYHYDGDGRATGREGRQRETTTKMAAARSAVATLGRQLGDGDRLGVVAYDDGARVVRDLAPVREPSALNRSVEGLRADGGTNLDAGIRAAVSTVERADATDDDRQTRVIYVTDAMPNAGQTGGDALRDRLSGLADRGISTTFVGVGVDFNSRLTETVAGVEGANYVTVDSAARFRQRMGSEFDYLVTPLAYDLSLSVAGEGWRVTDVYGAPGRDTGADEAAGGDGPDTDAAGREILHVDTLFPSRRDGNRTEGSVVLLRVERTVDDPGPLRVTAGYERPDGDRVDSVRRVTFPDREAPYYETTGVRKAVALTRYADLARNWAADARTRARARTDGDAADADVAVDAPVDSREYERSDWEQPSVALSVSPTYRERFARFADYFARERQALGSERMREDLAIVQRLASVDAGGPNGTDAAANATAARDPAARLPLALDPFARRGDDQGQVHRRVADDGDVARRLP